ncbi:RNA 2',3'-cyclic phosphodiesterase [Aurantiacibacter sp. MUD61]|uniref:RNA 2',3'-cyclic phosphodiesterase n=1 Tax=Aurantiacibacter sp. MUD61 TaxID=3009083 RepID=UPI0022F0BF11|nr:RNA 2',3'-cyclic phosphodiesterase [Aurantiacibacter sp. MUD61]
MSSRRLFVALRPPEEVCDILLDTMEGVAGARWQDADNLHITLRFIGEVDRHMFDDVVTALDSVPIAPFDVRIAGVGQFETKRRPTAIWARVEPSDGLRNLQHSVEMACRRAALEPVTRKFVPHITLARLSSGSAPIAGWIAQHSDLAIGPWRAEGFALYESNLTPQGAIYEQIETFG